MEIKGKVMKTTKILSLLAVALVMLTGCQDDDFGKKYGPANVGDEIIFGGTAGYEPEGRTVYGDKFPAEGNKLGYTEIKWYSGDHVRIFSAEATGGVAIDGGNYADYAVVNGLEPGVRPTNGKKEEKDQASLRAVDSNSSLVWGTKETHTFYGVYPAPVQLQGDGTDPESTDAKNSLELKGGSLKGFLPNNQTPWGGAKVTESTYGENGPKMYVVQPAMRYAYMVAKSTASLKDGAANLTFEPIVTAVEITLKNKSENSYTDVNGQEQTGRVSLENIEAFTVSSTTNIISGDFEATINGQGKNTVTTKSTDDKYKTVFIPVDKSITVEYGEYISFTAFMVLNDNTSLKDLTISIITQSGTKVATVSRKNGLEIVSAKKKNFINNLPLNIGTIKKDISGANWTKYLAKVDANNNPIYLKDISIPGAGGAASMSVYNQGKVMSAQQSLSISQQWAQGIRCFEFAVDRAGVTRDGDESLGLGGEYIISGGITTDMTLKKAVDEVVTCLDSHQGEFAMVIVTYENLNGWGGLENYERDPATFMSQLSAFWNNYSGKTALYSPSTTKVSDAIGKLFCIARPTSAYFDNREELSYGTALSAVNLNVTEDNLKVNAENCHEHILIINGWGSLKDKWEARGYTNNVFNRGTTRKSVTGGDSKPGRPFDTAGFTYKWSLFGYHWDGDNPEPGKYTSQVDKVNESIANFYYKTQSGKNSMTTSANAWVQEWARVSPSDAATVKVEIKGNLSNPQVNDSYRVFYWAPTINEKKLRIQQTLNYAIKDSLPGVDIYINSLCGYYIRPEEEYVESGKPFYRTDYSNSGSKNKVAVLTLKSETAGLQGDIDAYAKYINNYFYNLLLDYKSKNKLTGGLGIVLMDRVSNDSKQNAAGYYIPQFIWSNNQFEANTEIEGDLDLGDGEGDDDDDATEYSIR